MKERKDRVDDAMHATRAAVEEGIVPGGGVALLRAKKAVEKVHSDNADVQAGINIVLRALETPIRQIVENAGVEGSIVVSRVVESKSESYGFDAQAEEYKDLITAGIVDPILPLLDFDFRSSADADHCNAASELSETLLQLLLVVVRGGLFDLGLDLVDPALDVFPLAGIVDDGGLLLGNRDSLGAAEHGKGHVLELDAEVFRNHLALIPTCRDRDR